MGEVIVGGLLGAVTVLVGILTSEWLGRVRQRREDLEETVRTLLAEASPARTVLLRPRTGQEELPVPEPLLGMIRQGSKIQALARWPIRQHGAIREEAGRIVVRIDVAVIQWTLRGPLTVKETGEIVGGRLHALTFGPTPSVNDQLDEALRAKGLPGMEELVRQTFTSQEPENKE